MLSSIKGYLIGGAGLLIVTSVGFAYKNYVNIQDALITANGRISSLKQQEQRLVEANISLNKEYTLLISRIEKEQQLVKEFKQKNVASRKEVHRLEKLFDKHDFNYLYQKKSGLLIRKMNKATDKTLKIIQEIQLP